VMTSCSVHFPSSVWRHLTFPTTA